MRPYLLLGVFFPIALLAGFLISNHPPSLLLWGTLSLAIFTVSFINIEWGLYILIFSMLLSPEITIGRTEGASLGRGVTLRFEDFLLIVIGFSWFARNAINKELGLPSSNSVDSSCIVHSSKDYYGKSDFVMEF